MQNILMYIFSCGIIRCNSKLLIATPPHTKHLTHSPVLSIVWELCRGSLLDLKKKTERE